LKFITETNTITCQNCDFVFFDWGSSVFWLRPSNQNFTTVVGSDWRSQFPIWISCSSDFNDFTVGSKAPLVSGANSKLIELTRADSGLDKIACALEVSRLAHQFAENTANLHL
jgi:hypothetical protein